MKVALTGATGFIGRYIALEFMKPGDTLRALVRPTSDCGFLHRGAAELLTGDFGDDESMMRLVDGADAVIHNGYWHDRNELEEPMKWFELNLLGSLKLLEFARRAGVKRYLFISTGAVYGRRLEPDKPVDELTPCFPGGGYAAYNLSVEHYVAAHRSEFDMTGSTSIRLAGTRNIGLLPKIEKSPYFDMVQSALAGRDIVVKGAEQPDWCADIASNLRVLLDLPLGRVEEVYVFCDECFPMKAVAEAIVRALASSSRVVETEPTAAKPVASNARILAAGGRFSGLAGIETYARELAEAIELGRRP